MTIRRQASNIKSRCHLVHLIQESCPDISRTIVRIIAELTSEYYKMLVPNRQESSRFALSIGMDRTYYASVEAGKRNISIKNIEKIADGFGIPIAKLMSETEKIKSITERAEG